MVSKEVKTKIDKFITSHWMRADYKPLFDKTIYDPIDGCSLEEMFSEIQNKIENHYPTNKTQELNLLKIVRGLLNEMESRIKTNAHDTLWNVQKAKSNEEARKIFYEGRMEESRLCTIKTDLECTCMLSKHTLASNLGETYMFDRQNILKQLSDEDVMIKHIERYFDERLKNMYMEVENFTEEVMKKHPHKAPTEEEKQVMAMLRNVFFNEFKKQAIPEVLEKENEVVL